MKLKVTRFGDSAEGIELHGKRSRNEPDHVRITFPGGDVEVVRAKDGDDPDYWVHVRINHKDHGMFVQDEDIAGSITSARMDILGMNSSDVNVGDFDNPGLYHAAFRINPKW